MKYSYLYIISSIVAIMLVTNGCKKDSIILPEPDYTGYFPDKAGSYIIYDCDSLYYNSFTSMIDTFKFQIKEFYESAYTDNANRRAIRIERWKKTDSLNWWLKDVWSLAKTQKQVEKVEEDLRLVKLVFPVKNEKEWNINALNSGTKRIVNYQDAHKPFSTGVLNFDSTVTVVNIDPVNLVNEYRDTEIFALNVGLVYKRYVDVQYVVPTLQIKSGVIFTMRAVEIGNE